MDALMALFVHADAVSKTLICTCVYVAHVQFQHLETGMQVPHDVPTLGHDSRKYQQCIIVLLCNHITAYMPYVLGKPLFVLYTCMLCIIKLAEAIKVASHKFAIQQYSPPTSRTRHCHFMAIKLLPSCY
jgi:hypothetical protein